MTIEQPDVQDVKDRPQAPPRMPSYLTEGWPDEERITAIMEGHEQPPRETEAVLRLMRQRFGCVFKQLPDDRKVQPDILQEAVVQSSGHALEHIPVEVRHNIGRQFFIEAIGSGAAGWIIKYGSDAVRRDKAVQIAAIKSHPAAVDFVLDPDNEVKAMIEARLRDMRKTSEQQAA